MLNITIPAGVAPGDMFQVQVPIMPQVPAINNAPFWGGAIFRPFCPDRLGTSMGKVETEGVFFSVFCGRAPPALC